MTAAVHLGEQEERAVGRDEAETDGEAARAAGAAAAARNVVVPVGNASCARVVQVS